MENKENLPPVQVAAVKKDAKDVVAPPKVALAPAAPADANVPVAAEKEISSSVPKTKTGNTKGAAPEETATVATEETTPAAEPVATPTVTEVVGKEEAQVKQAEEAPKAVVNEEEGDVVESVDITSAPDAAPACAQKAKLKPLSPTAEPFVMSGAFTTPRKAPPLSMGAGGFGTPSSISGSLPPMTPQRGSALRTPRSARSAQTTPVSPNVELTAKQVRELRRLCRKTANRAEYEGRLVQLRQIASILAMGGPSLVHFAPSYLSAHSAMQAWLDASRADGADWRDERPLTAPAVEELREWDRLLKAWAKRRFPTLADCTDGSAPPTTPRSKRLDLMSLASPMSNPGTPSPARNLVASQTLASPTSCPVGNRRAPASHMTISTDGDTINVSIVRTPDKASGAAGKSPWRVTASPRNGGNNANQENVTPEGDQSPRDWGSLRKPGPTAADKPTVPIAPLKARNW